MKFQGLILAAGDSKRLSSLTKDMPKSFLEISNKKIIYYHLEYFSSIGLQHVTIVVTRYGRSIGLICNDSAEGGFPKRSLTKK